MPNCQSFQDEVDRLRDLLQAQDEECRRTTDPVEARICRQIRVALAARLRRAQAALENCQRGLPEAGIRRADGRVSFLRVHDQGGYGPPSDHLDGEVVFKLDTQANRAFGFELRNDAKGAAHEGMLLLLRDALAHGFDVAADYQQVQGKANSVAFRIEITPGDDVDIGLGGLIAHPLVSTG
ncbi:MAG: hypothetical protein ACRDMV_22655 [Streptosporangiales bacterium]